MFDFLFGKKCKKKTRKYNVKGSPCNKLKKTKCKSKKGCTYVRCRGCRRAKGFVLKFKHKLKKHLNETINKSFSNNNAPTVDEVVLALSAASDNVNAIVLYNGGTPRDTKYVLSKIMPKITDDVIKVTGVSQEEAREIKIKVNKMIKDVPSEESIPLVIKEAVLMEATQEADKDAGSNNGKNDNQIRHSALIVGASFIKNYLTDHGIPSSDINKLMIYWKQNYNIPNRSNIPPPPPPPPPKQKQAIYSKPVPKKKETKSSGEFADIVAEKARQRSMRLNKPVEFGKRRRRKTAKRPSKRLLRLCKKYRIKTTIKRGKKRVYKKISVLKKLIKLKSR